MLKHHPYGLLQPLPPPSKPWQSISIDFFTDLPSSQVFYVINNSGSIYQDVIFFALHKELHQCSRNSKFNYA
jgi:hypothetical protein